MCCISNLNKHKLLSFSHSPIIYFDIYIAGLQNAIQKHFFFLFIYFY